MNSVQVPEAEACSDGHHHHDHHHHHKTVTVEVNKKHVKFHVHEATGMEIKLTAIREGVENIQPDFSLFEHLGHGRKRQISDDEVVCLHEGQKFRALAPDDNS